MGILTKAEQSSERTNQLYEAATKNSDDLTKEIDPSIQRAEVNVNDLSKKNKMLKEHLENLSGYGY